MTDPRIEAAAEALHTQAWQGDPSLCWPCDDPSHLEGQCTEWYRIDAEVAIAAADKVDPLRQEAPVVLKEWTKSVW